MFCAFAYHHAPPRPKGAAHTLHSGAGMVHKAAPTSCTTEPHRDSVLRNQVGYTGPRERTSRRDGRASQETSHPRAVRTWDRPQSYHTRSWAVKHFDQCLCPTSADPGAQHVASAMQHLAQPWFLHQRAVLGASLMDSYRDVLDDLVRQSRHWNSLLRRARVWTTSADQHYQRHNRRIQLFSVMSQLWAFAMCPALRGSTVSYAGDAHFPKHSLEYSLNFWSQSKKKNNEPIVGI